MSRVKEALSGKKSFIGFLAAGDPSIDKTEEFIVEIARAGAAIVEIGIPFSDPIAEGPVVQEANVRALSAPGGCTTDMVFDMVAKASKKVDVPLVLLTYLNPVYKYGYERFCAKCKETGVDGIIIPDLSYEEKGELLEEANKYGIDIISLISTNSGDRINMIAPEATGYIYILPSEDNVAEGELSGKLLETVGRIRKLTDTPVVIEFGANTPEQIARYSDIADGIIIETRIVKLIEKYGADAGKHIYDYVKKMVDSI